MNSIRRKLTAETVNNLVSSARVNSLVTAETVNELIDGSGILGVVAGASVGDVGTYAYLRRKTEEGNIISGQIYSYSDLAYSGNGVLIGGTGQDGNDKSVGGGVSVDAGEWLALGCVTTAASRFGSTLFKRVS